MKKTIYCKPEIEVTKLNFNQFLMSSIIGTGAANIGSGGDADDPEIDPAAKGFWDDEEDY